MTKDELREQLHEGINATQAAQSHRARACQVLDEWIELVPGDEITLQELATLIEKQLRD
jgi:hypothetical protein